MFKLKNLIMKKLVFLFSAVILGLFMAQSAKALVSIPDTDFDSVATINAQYQYQIVAVPDNGPAVFTLLEGPDDMTLSASGLLEWVPTSMDQGGLVQFSVVDDDMVPNIKSFYIYVSTAIECNDTIVAYWKMNEPGSGIYEDFANGHNAEAYTLPGYDVNGKVDTAQRLISPNNDTRFLHVDDDAFDFSGDDNFSVAFWFKNKPHYTTEPEIWFAKDDDGGGNNWWWMGLDNTSNRLVFEYEYGSGTDNYRVTDTDGPTFDPNDTSWHHVVVHFHGSTSTLDGVGFAHNGGSGHYYQTEDQDVTFTSDQPLTIGYWAANGPTNYYTSTVVLDEVVFFNNSLTTAQISALYNDGDDGKEVCKIGNTAPLIKTTPLSYASEGSEYTYTLEYGEIDPGDVVVLSDSILPSWLSFDGGTGLLSGTPDNGDIGDTTVSLKVSDGKINLYQTFTLTVGNVNTAPDITSTGPTTVNEDVEYSYQVVVEDDDIIHGDVISYTAPTKPDWLTMSATGLLSGTPTNEVLGTNPSVDFDVVVHVEDASTAYDEESFTITVTNINDAPVINSQFPDPITTAYNTSILITTSHLDVTDVDNNYPADFTLTVSEGLNYTIEGNTVTPATDFVGALSVGVEISDGDLTDEYDLTVNVEGPNAIRDAETMGISIYPVPASENITFEMNAELVQKIMILDMQGRTLKSVDVANESTIKIDVSDLKSNIYLYKIIGEDNCASGIIPIN